VITSSAREHVERALRGQTPERLHTHAVEVNGKSWPPKQAFEAATGLDRLDFTKRDVC